MPACTAVSFKWSAQTARSMGRSAKMITPDTPLPQAAVKAATLFLGGDIGSLVANVSEFMAASLSIYCTEKLSSLSCGLIATFRYLTMHITSR